MIAGDRLDCVGTVSSEACAAATSAPSAAKATSWHLQWVALPFDVGAAWQRAATSDEARQALRRCMLERDHAAVITRRRAERDRRRDILNDHPHWQRLWFYQDWTRCGLHSDSTEALFTTSSSEW